MKIKKTKFLKKLVVSALAVATKISAKQVTSYALTFILLLSMLTTAPFSANVIAATDDSKVGAFIPSTGWMDECKPYQNTNVTEYLSSTTNTFKVAGDEYKEGLVFYNWYATSISQTLFNLDGKYDAFSFDFAKVDGTKVADTTMTVYIDGQIKDKIDFSATSSGKRVNLKLDGANQLKLVVQHDAHAYDVYYALFNGVWTKNGKSGSIVEKSPWLSKCAPYELGYDKKVVTVTEDNNEYILMGGKEYTNALKLYMWNGTYSKAYANFKLNRRYDIFNFTIGHIDNTTRAQGTLEIKLDEKIIQTINLEADDLPRKFTVPISGANQLTLEMYSNTPANTYDIYYGIAEANFTKNTQVNLSSCEISLDSNTTTYSGNKFEPNVTIKDGTYTLIKNVDYSVTYQNNVNAGNGKIIIKGIDDYKGTVEKNFTIKARNISSASINSIPDQSYTSEAIMPNVTVKLGSTTLKNGKDYNVTYSNNINCGKASVKITGAGNYSGELNTSFKIVANAPNSIKLDKSVADIQINKTLTLTATLTPDKAYIKNTTVKWSTSNEKIATVSNGKVTAKAVGTATITAETSNGKKATCKVTVEDTTPKITSVNANNSGVAISWNKVSGVPKYRVYKKVNGTWKKLGDTTGTSFTDKTVKANNTYTYTVRGITANGSSFVTDYNKTGVSIKYTATPSITKKEVTSQGIKLTWNKPAGTQKVRLYIKKNGSWTKVCDTTGTSYTYKDVKSGTSYAFTVRAISSDGKQFTSGYSANGWSQKYVSTPQISSLTNTNNGVQIKYNKPAGAVNFRIYRKTGNGSWTKIGDTTATTFTDKTAKSGTTYSYTVRSISSDAKSFTSYYNTNGWSQKYVSTPQISSLTNTKNGVQIKYNKPTGAVKFRIYRKTGNGSWTKIGDTTSTSFVDKTAKSGTTYSYTVRCISSDGKSFTSYYNTSGKSIKCKK